MSKYQRKNLLKCTTVNTGSVKVVDFDGLFLTPQFLHSKRDFWLKPTIPEKFYMCSVENFFPFNLLDNLVHLARRL